MKPATKAVYALAAASATNGATATAQIDTMGYDFVSVDVLSTTADVVSNKFSVCKIAHSDTTDSTNYSDVTKFVAGTNAGNFTLANADTSNAYIVKYNVDTRSLKRYLKVSVSPRTTQTIGVVANLSIADQTPTTAAGAGVNTLIEG